MIESNAFSVPNSKMEKKVSIRRRRKSPRGEPSTLTLLPKWNSSGISLPLEKTKQSYNWVTLYMIMDAVEYENNDVDDNDDSIIYVQRIKCNDSDLGCAPEISDLNMKWCDVKKLSAKCILVAGQKPKIPGDFCILEELEGNEYLM